jgi:hypothetical protein
LRATALDAANAAVSSISRRRVSAFVIERCN